MSTEMFSASRASRLMGCHASANLDVAIPGWVAPVEDPNKDNAANRGTRAHEILAEIVGQGARETKNFARALTYVAELMSMRRFKRLVEVEEPVWWLDPTITTTADLVLYVKNEIHIIDWKWGKIPVPVENNQQMLYYAATYSGYAPKAPGVHMHIVQPAIDNLEVWFADAQEINLFMLEAKKHHVAIKQQDITFLPGDWCTFCPANPQGRGQKGHPLCPVRMEMLHPEILDEEEFLGRKQT